MNLSLILELALAGHPDRVAVASGDRRMTFAELDGHARGVAARLADKSERAVIYIGPSSCAAAIAAETSSGSVTSVRT